MCPRKPDREEIDLLQELQRLQAGEPVPDIEPPALIDQAVRNLARREWPQKRSPHKGNLPWIAGLSTASIALIALGISMVQTPPAPGPENETFENRTNELRSAGEPHDLGTPAAPQLSRSAQAPAADAAASANGQLLRQSAEMAKETASPRPGQDNHKVQRSGLDSALADSAYDNSQAAGAAITDHADSLDARENSARAWLDLIEQLQNQGLHAETLEQLRAWQQQYPELALPDWAAALLQAQP